MGLAPAVSRTRAYLPAETSDSAPTATIELSQSHPRSRRQMPTMTPHVVAGGSPPLTESSFAGQLPIARRCSPVLPQRVSGQLAAVRAGQEKGRDCAQQRSD
jgi:hypothetical protein